MTFMGDFLQIIFTDSLLVILPVSSGLEESEMQQGLASFSFTVADTTSLFQVAQSFGLHVESALIVLMWQEASLLHQSVKLMSHTRQ